MIVNKEFILNEEDIKEAIIDHLSYDYLEDSDKAVVEIRIIADDKDDNKGIKIEAVCKETVDA